MENQRSACLIQGAFAKRRRSKNTCGGLPSGCDNRMLRIGAGRNPTIIEIIQLGHAGFSLRFKLRWLPQD
ncbi:hypothetical protein EII20_05865 [Comamonadaceae bacterium OH2545_COT-014]|nr:hypothetical protein EII20_05865 [Comamonadaceae bacterium OH2545_COT-014]